MNEELGRNAINAINAMFIGSAVDMVSAACDAYRATVRRRSEGAVGALLRDTAPLSDQAFAEAMTIALGSVIAGAFMILEVGAVPISEVDQLKAETRALLQQAYDRLGSPQSDG